MTFEMRLRAFVCPDCAEAFKSTSPNAVRCSLCAKLNMPLTMLIIKGVAPYVAKVV